MITKTDFNWRNESLAALFLIAFFIGVTKVIEHYIGTFQQTLNPKPLLAAAMLIPMLFGAALAAIRLIPSRTPRRLNWKRLLIQGLPALVLAVPVLLWAWPGLESKYVFWWPLQRSNNIVTILAGVWFGWAVVSSLEAREDDSTNGPSAETQDLEAGSEEKPGDKIG
ncbi:MAG: hypothetical protein QMC81_02195 [Thermoanaerobacterales bacterium]|nr:hypothetical protein [Thermoanaerobacterales bacterium]